MVVRAVLGVAAGAAVIAAALSGAWSTEPPRVTAVVPLPADAQPMLVSSVISGDTVVLTSVNPGSQVRGWGKITVRLRGIDAPDFGPTGTQCFAPESRDYLARLLPGGSIAWVTTHPAGGAAPTDAGGANPGEETLGYVWASDRTLVNLRLTQAGFAVTPRSNEPDDLYLRLAQSSEQAFRHGAGLWGGCS